MQHVVLQWTTWLKHGGKYASSYRQNCLFGDVNRLHTAKSCIRTSRRPVFTRRTSSNPSQRGTQETGPEVSRPLSWIIPSRTCWVKWRPVVQCRQHPLRPPWRRPVNSWSRLSSDYNRALQPVQPVTLLLPWRRRGLDNLFNRSSSLYILPHVSFFLFTHAVFKMMPFRYKCVL